MSVQYEATPGGTWTILCEGDITEVQEDLTRYGITCEGEIRGNANISGIVPELVDDNLKRRFVAGLADTIGSMAKSQRRFSDEHQILSFEIKGYNFQFVCDLCKLLYSINCIPDQVNWNHPNIHCTSDPYYSQWNKGFKLRILLDQYARFGAFAFRTKAETSNENRRLQQQTHEAERCEDRNFHVTPSCVHPAENDQRLPESIRGGHYLHFRHFCTVLGCEHAPYGEVCNCFANLGELIIPFPILCKDANLRIEEIIQDDPLMSQREYVINNVSISSLLAIYNENADSLFGKRPKGYIQIIERHIEADEGECVEIRRPDLLTPLVIVGNGRGALIGACNPDVYSSLVTRDPDNEYKLIVRQITEEDLRNADQT